MGAGFGGLWAARALARSSAEILVVDRNNYHTFLPLLYQVGAAELEPEAIVYPIRSILRKMRNADFHLGDVREIDFTARIVRTSPVPPFDRLMARQARHPERSRGAAPSQVEGRPQDGASAASIPYDYLILALGSTAHFFGVPGAEEHAFRLKTLDDGIRLRNHILRCFERAACLPPGEVDRGEPWLTFAIVGGGPTGVEFAGALAELVRHPLRRDFPHLDWRAARVVLLEAADGLLPGWPDSLRRYAALRLEKIGVEVRLQATVQEVEPHVVRLKDGTGLPTETVVWTAGVQGDPQARAWGLATGKSGRVKVLPTLQVPDHPEVYVLGDLAYVEQDGQPLPMIAPAAIQQGWAAAENILRQMKGQAPRPFRFRDPGMMATVGRNAAVADLRGHTFTGFLAWLIWLAVHLFKLIGFRNRMMVMLAWAWDYFLFERVVRLILPSDR